eukprot:4363962-Pyramimonas_sp.AAC.1
MRAVRGAGSARPGAPAAPGGGLCAGRPSTPPRAAPDSTAAKPCVAPECASAMSWSALEGSRAAPLAAAAA